MEIAAQHSLHLQMEMCNLGKQKKTVEYLRHGTI